EARFAVDQALDRWPENGTAQRARAELEELAEQRRARDMEMRRAARDIDVTLSKRQRDIALFCIVTVGVVTSAVTIGRWAAGHVFTLVELTVEGACMAFFSTALVFRLRKALAKSLPNRIAATLVIAGTMIILASRLIGLAAGTPLAPVLTRDCLIF